MTDLAAAPPGAFERRLPFEAIFNFRDLGGYATRYGRPTRLGAVYRSSALHGATPGDRERLAALGVGRIFDLRSFPELEREGFEGFEDIGCQREHTPVFADTDASPEALIARYRLYSEDFAAAYMLMLRDGAPAIRRVAAAIAEGDTPLVYHCAGGKDRAGVLSALLLSLAGVDRETVIADYALTSEYLPPPKEERIAEFESLGLSRAEYLALRGAAPDSMARTLDRIAETYGGVEGYLGSIGLDRATLERARERLLAG